MKTYTPAAGMRLEKAIAAMCAIADDANEDVRGTFNGVDLMVRPGADPIEVQRQWHQEMNRLGDEYRNSPKGIRDAARRKAEIVLNQGEVAALARELQDLDMTDLEAVMRWLIAFAEPAGDVGVVKDGGAVVLWFDVNGYYPNENTNDAFDPNDRENVGRYLIGQALAGISSLGAPHPMFISWANAWLEGKMP